MNIIDTFSLSPVVSFDYKGNMNEIIEYSNSIEYKESGGKTNQKSKNHYVLDELKDLREFCIKCCEDYCKSICDVNCGIDIQQSWINVNKTGDSFSSHWHPNSYLSGVFYIASDVKKGAPIRFHNPLKNFSYYPDPQVSMIGTGIMSDGRNKYTMGQYDIASIPGKLLVFSSMLTHSVPMNRSEESRVSLSFNTTPKRPFGSEDRFSRIA